MSGPVDIMPPSFFRPEQGALISNSGGLRKIRWSEKGKGKRGGLRVIYYWDEPDETIYMLFFLKEVAR